MILPSRKSSDHQANLVLRHGWYRVLLHVRGMVRCPRNIPWHWRHIRHEFYGRN